MRTSSILLHSIIGLAIIACSSASATTSDGGVSDAPGDSAQGSLLGFTPSNVDLSGMDMSQVGDVVLTGPNCFLQTEDGGFSCANKGWVNKTMTLPDQSRLAVYVVRSLTIDPSTVLVVDGGLGHGGHIPFAIVALDKITLNGSIKVGPGFGGGAYNALDQTQGAGLGGGGGGMGSLKAAGGGGSYCGIGGAGATEPNATPFAKSKSYGASELIPLIGGSAGGMVANRGSGGGALELVAKNSIEVHAGAFISVPGGGGQQGGLASGQEAGGGGSGGAILLESPSITIAGTLSANGGGGGEGAGGDASSGASGDDGHDMDATPAKGGANGMNNNGGSGGAGASADGNPGVSANSATASGGGGGVGRIRLNTKTGSAAVTGTLSPAMGACATQGKLTP